MVCPRLPLPLRDLHRHFPSFRLRALRLACFGASSDFLPFQLLPTVLNLHRSIFPLAHQHLALRRCMVLALSLDLIDTIGMSHHPIVAERSLSLQPQYGPHRLGAGARQVIVLLAGRSYREAPVMFRTVFLFKIAVHLFQATDLPPPKLLHQPVLMRSVIPFHPSFGLGELAAMI